MQLLWVLIGASLFVLLVLMAAVESAVGQLSRLALRVLAEKHTGPRYRLLELVARDRRHFLLPLQYSTQLILVGLTVLVASQLAGAVESAAAVTLAVMILVVTFVRQAIPYFLTQGRAERVLLFILPPFRHLYRLVSLIAFPLMSLLKLVAARRDGEMTEEDDEATEEEILAYLGVGEEEGIFEREETELIQSALEFGDTLVREIMTPRNEIVATEEGTTLGELRELIVNTKHSRIPVYKERIDQMVGLVNVRSLLAHLEEGRAGEPITPIVGEIFVVPENKRVADLLKEMQLKAHQLAVAVNEYGTVSGLITVEDLLEEIVGEIRDEDEFRRVDVVYEGDRSYIVRGSVEVGELENVLGVEFSEHDAATVSGLIVDHLGSVPAPGEVIVFEGVSLQVLSTDRKRIHTLRVRLVQPLDNDTVTTSRTEAGSSSPDSIR